MKSARKNKGDIKMASVKLTDGDSVNIYVRIRDHYPDDVFYDVSTFLDDSSVYICYSLEQATQIALKVYGSGAFGKAFKWNKKFFSNYVNMCVDAERKPDASVTTEPEPETIAGIVMDGRKAYIKLYKIHGFYEVRLSSGTDPLLPPFKETAHAVAAVYDKWGFEGNDFNFEWDKEFLARHAADFAKWAKSYAERCDEY